MSLAALLLIAQGASPVAGGEQGFFDPVTQLFSFRIPLPPWAVIAILLGAGAVFHFVLRGALRRWAARTDNGLDDFLVALSGKVVPLWVVLSVAYIGVEMLDVAERADLRRLAFGAIGFIFLLSLYWALSSLLLDALSRWAGRNPQFQPVFPPVRFVLKAALVVVAGVSLLAYLDVNVSALLATLGVGGLAVALALRDTLENFFAGLHIMADRPMREGDWILVHEIGERGRVLKVGWRSTRIQTTDLNVLVVPNVKLASGMITNLTLRDPRILVRIQVGVSYDADPDRVAGILEEEARAAVGSIPGLLADPPPAAALHPGFGPSSLDFTLRAAAATTEDGPVVQDLLRRRVLLRLRREGIEIPYPVTTVRVARDEATPPGV